MPKNEVDRLKLIETELAYLRKTIEEFTQNNSFEIHHHYHYDYSNMRPMIINDLKGLQDFIDDIES